MKALVIGEILWDIIEGTPHLGGAPLNFAAHVKKCGHQSAMISCLGSDDLGDKALKMVEDMGVDVSLVQRSDKPTGYVPVTLRDGQPEYEITEDVAYDYIDSSKLDFDYISQFDSFYFGSIIQRSALSNHALYDILQKHQFDNIFYDVNLRKNSYTRSVIERSLEYCTTLKVNDEEVEVIGQMLFGQSLGFESFCKHICSRFEQIKTIIITAGKEGSVVYSGNLLSKVHAEEITVVDTVGAGDSFSAAFISIFAKTGDAVKSAEIANKVGAFVASSHGPIPQYSEDLVRLLAEI